jgi:hypothetical protein
VILNDTLTSTHARVKPSGDMFVLTIERVAPGPMEAETPETTAKSKRRERSCDIANRSETKKEKRILEQRPAWGEVFIPRVGRRHRAESDQLRRRITAQISEMSRLPSDNPGDKPVYLARPCIPHGHGLNAKDLHQDRQPALRLGCIVH